MNEMLNEVKVTRVIPAVNYHLWQRCCMDCKFCFAKFDKKFREDQSAINSAFIVKSAFKAGVSKISFAGGEPLLCPWLPDLLYLAKSLGMTTMVISNGYLLREDWLNKNSINIDWFTLSIDSLSEKTNRNIGRSVQGKAILESQYFELASIIKSYGIKLKINTTITSCNWRENLSDFIVNIQPVRWKIFQVLPIIGQNDLEFHKIKVNKEQFESFLENHRVAQDFCNMVAEDNHSMNSSYLMIDPYGRFYDNELGFYRYSEPIWDISWTKALSQIYVSSEKFVARGGVYNW